jgi:hypothetical protein
MDTLIMKRADFKKFFSSFVLFVFSLNLVCDRAID